MGIEKIFKNFHTSLVLVLGPWLMFARHKAGITSGPISGWYWCKASITSGDTRLVCSSTPVLLVVNYILRLHPIYPHNTRLHAPSSK